MPEVFAIILIKAWRHDRKVVSEASILSNWHNFQIFFKSYIFFYIKTKAWKQKQKLFAVFSTATCFALPEIHGRKEVISSPL